MTNRVVDEKVSLKGKRAVVAIDFNHARIYAIDAPTHARPDAIRAQDPWNLDHNLYHRDGNPDGHYDIDLIDTDKFFQTIAHEISAADEVLLLGHGTGKSNASHLFEAYLRRHYSDVADKIVADVRCDIDDITDSQLLRLGELYFGSNEPPRDHADGRWGEPHAKA